MKEYHGWTTLNVGGTSRNSQVDNSTDAGQPYQRQQNQSDTLIHPCSSITLGQSLLYLIGPILLQGDRHIPVRNLVFASKNRGLTIPDEQINKSDCPVHHLLRKRMTI